MDNQALHLKFGFSEAVAAKKNLLSTQLNFLQIMQRTEKYLELRKRELITKGELRERIKELVTEINNLLHELPKITEEETKFEKEYADTSKSSQKEKKSKGILEFELREIKRKLKALEELS